MAVDHVGKIGRWALWSPVVIVPALIALMPWVENDWIAAVFGIYVMGYSTSLAARVNRRLDEVQIAGQRFATTKAMTIGTFAAALVMLFPPSMNALQDLANSVFRPRIAGQGGQSRNHRRLHAAPPLAGGGPDRGLHLVGTAPWEERMTCRRTGHEKSHPRSACREALEPSRTGRARARVA